MENGILASLSILCFNKRDVTIKCFDSLSKTLPKENVEVLITNNGSTDDTDNIVLFAADFNNKVYIPYNKNRGFIRGHNEALKLARGQYFVVLNNDIMFVEKNWLYKLLKPLEDDPKIGLVGIAGNPNSLRNNGTGFWGKDLEYVDGSCIAGRTEDFRKYGLFSESLEMFYYEDSDLSLRFRQMGYKIHVVPVNHQHQRSSTANTINPDFRAQILAKNGEVFNKRWGTYLRNRMFSGHVQIKCSSHGIGDIISMTPVIEALRKDHPKAKIEIETPYPEVFENNPYVDEVYSKPKTNFNYSFDRRIDLTLNYASRNLIIEECEKIAATKVENKVPQLYMTKDEINNGASIIEKAREKSEVVIGVCGQMARSTWAGRNWGFKNTEKLIRKLEENNISVVELGKGVKSTGLSTVDLIDKTNLRELFSVVANLDYFIGIDSACFHVAQAFGVQSYILFGATEPCSRITNFSNTFPIRLNNLPCIGCYMEKGISSYNQCIATEPNCMNDLDADVVFDYLVGNINQYESNIKYLQNLIRGE